MITAHNMVAVLSYIVPYQLFLNYLAHGIVQLSRRDDTITVRVVEHVVVNLSPGVDKPLSSKRALPRHHSMNQPYIVKTQYAVYACRQQ